MAINKDLVTGLYVAIYDRAPDQEGRDGWLSALDAGTYNATTMAAAFIEAAPAKFSELYDGKTNEEVVQAAYNNILGRDGEDAGVANWTAFLEANGQDAFFASFVESALDYDPANDTASDDATKAAATTAQQALTNKVEAGNYFADTLGAKSNGAIDSDIYNESVALLDGVTDDVATVAAAQATVDQLNVDTPDPGAGEGTTFTLTEGQDQAADFAFTAQDDTFNAYVFDNQNTLQSGDMLDGGAGRDTLNAVVGNSQDFAINAYTQNIEVVSLRAQASAFDRADNDVTDESIDKRVQIDAQDMKGVQEWWSTDSRANLVIEDVRLEESQITSDVTIGMRNTDAGDVNYEVYFEDNSLRAAPDNQAGAQLNIRLMDLKNATDGEPLKEDPYVGFHFLLDGQRVEVRADEIKDAETYDDLLTAVQNAVAATAGLEDFVVAKTGTFTRADANGVIHQGDVITLTNNGSGIITEGGWLIGADGVPGDSNLVAEQDNEAPASTGFLVTSDIILDNVGRGSKSGDLVVGNMSQGDYSGSKGIQQFNVEVQRDSALANMRSTNNSLEVVNVENGTGFDGNLKLDGTGDAVAHEGDVTEYGLSDVRVFNADDMDGSVTLTAELTETSVSKYLDLKDDAASASSDNQTFAYTLGANDDNLKLAVSEELAAHEDFALSVVTGSGDDVVTVDLNNDAGNNLDLNWLADQGMLNNYTVNTGAGDDVVNTLGQGEASISTGTGNDDVFTDNTGDTEVAFTQHDNTAAFVFNAAAGSTDITDLLGKESGGSELLYKATLSVTFAGFTSSVEIETADMMGDEKSINQAMKKAINEDRVLSSLLEARDGANNTLVVESKVDGIYDTDDIAISINAVDIDDLTQAELSQIEQRLQVAEKDSTLDLSPAEIETRLAQGAATISNNYGTEVQATETVERVAADGSISYESVDRTGTLSSDVTANTVNVGSGDDLVVLGTGAGADKIVFTGYGNDKVSVLHFNGADGQDELVFDSYFNTKVSESNSTESQKLVTDSNIFVNKVFTLGESFVADADQNETFENLTATKLLEILKDADKNYGSLSASDFSQLVDSNNTVTDLVGSDRDHVIAITNSANANETKYFHVVTTEQANGENSVYSSVQFISTVDLGEDNAANTGGVNLFTSGTLAQAQAAQALAANYVITDSAANLLTALNSADAAAVAAATALLNGASTVNAEGTQAEINELGTKGIDDLATTVTDGGNTDPTYALSASAAAANEGDTVTFTLNTTNVADGTALNYNLTGVDGADVDVPANGQVTVNNGVATLTVALAEDAATEGPETMSLNIAGQSSSVTVNDTSTGAGGNTDPTYALTASAAAANEGETVTFTLNTTNVPDGDVAYEISGTGIDTNDITGDSLTGNMTVANGVATLDVALLEDATTENEETLTLTVAGETIDLTINDTSTDSGNTGGNTGGGDKTDTSADVGTAAAAETIDAATGSLNFTDDASAETNVVIQNFTSDDQISVSNAAAGDYSFTSNGSDYIITFNNGGTLNSITLEGATGADGLVFNEASFESQIGFDAFLLV